MDIIKDCLTGKKLKKVPEEVVRQNIILYLLKLGFPKSMISSECLIRNIVNTDSDLSFNRVDLISFYRDLDQIRPLLLIECKNNKSDKKAFLQVKRYNNLINAPFLVLVNKIELKFFERDGGINNYLEYIPRYDTLVRSLK